METFIVALIVLAAVIAAFNAFVKTFKSGKEAPCGCGCSCSGCDVVESCAGTAEKPE